MVLNNALEEFYYYFDENLDLISSDEIKAIVSEKKYNSGFYEICLKYSEIALNAPKFKDEKSGEIGACFQYGDINTAVSATCMYIKENNIKEYKQLLSSIRSFHRYAIKDNENRVTSKYISSYDNPNMMGYGMYYDFLDLPDDLWNKIIDDVTAGLAD